MGYKKGLSSLLMASALGSGACAGNFEADLVKAPKQDIKVAEPETLSKILAAEKDNKNETKENDGVYGISPEARDMLLDCAVKIEVEYALEKKIGETVTKDFLNSYGSGFQKYDPESGKTYILTAYHVLPTQKELLGMKVLETKITVENHPAEIVKLNKTFDLGMIKLNGNFLNRECKIKLAEKTKVGDLIAGAGYPRGEGKAFYAGHVAGEDLAEGIEKYIKRNEEANNEYTRIRDIYDIFGIPNFVVLDVHLTPGNSGGEICVFENGQPKLSGLVHIGYRNKEGLKGITPTPVLEGFLYNTAIADEMGVKKK
ncbi:MAG: serine protease [Nanoarchaeota archaeon]|nr:serine protease [Nanoarchaeota archaeon]MBU1643560.1 serine protease [Nanoarchaeota archaeon]MBU1976532.1 serine protease [Nanoarchaeota archaeon]